MKKYIAGFLVFGFCTCSFAQFDVDVGGDIELRAIYRDGFGLTAGSTSQDWFDSYVRAYIEGKPSRGVSTYLRVIGERDWGAEGITTTDPVTGLVTTEENTTRIDLDLAYLALAEAWGGPATITLGRQELLYGEGFLIGRNNTYRTGTYERSPRKAFDAARVSFALDPFVLDIFTALIDEGYDESDVNLHGINLTYDYHDTAVVDLGIFYKSDSGNDSKTMAFSVRGESEVLAVPGLTVKAEFVPEIGEYSSRRDLSALGSYVGAVYSSQGRVCFLKEPYIGTNYILMSGEANPSATTGDYEQFDPLYEDEIYGEINEVNSNLGLNTNAKILNIGFGGKFTEVTSVAVDYYVLSRSENVSGSDDFGTEIDLKLTYEYTEDVEFSLLVSYFDPEPVVGTEEAIQVLGGVKIAF